MVKLIRAFTILFFLTILSDTLIAQSLPGAASDAVAVALFEQQRPQSLIVRPEGGRLSVSSGGKPVTSVTAGELLFITVSDGKVRIRTITRAIGTFSEVEVTSESSKAPFTIQPLTGGATPRTYSGTARVATASGALRTILTIDLERYISGVVEAEVGSKQVAEMYKVQAIIARTYALSNMHKHEVEGFDLCDDVHCQAFKGISGMPLILDACTATHDLVVVNENDELIAAAFHANCGGETANSEDVWSSAKSYLRSVKCPYCSASHSYTWRAAVPLVRWAAYISEKGVRASVDNVPRQFNQPERKVNLDLGRISIPLKTIRADFALRSSFFSYKIVRDSVVFTGRGYGHGVGLCQDGASAMAAQSMPYDQIISYYYKDCRVANRLQSHSEADPVLTALPHVGPMLVQPDSLSREVTAKQDSLINKRALFPKRQ